MTRYSFYKEVGRLKVKGKTVHIGRPLLAKGEGLRAKLNLPLPKDSQDLKFIIAALASNAEYVITIDEGLRARS